MDEGKTRADNRKRYPRIILFKNPYFIVDLKWKLKLGTISTRASSSEDSPEQSKKRLKTESNTK